MLSVWTSFVGKCSIIFSPSLKSELSHLSIYGKIFNSRTDSVMFEAISTEQDFDIHHLCR